MPIYEKRVLFQEKGANDVMTDTGETSGPSSVETGQTDRAYSDPNLSQEEIRRETREQHTTYVKVDFGTSFKFWLAYLLMTIIAFFIAILIAIVIFLAIYPYITGILSHYGLSVLIILRW